MIQVLVVDLYIPEILCGVTTAAVGTELAMMDVILPVAGVTLCGQIQVRRRWLVVALIAAQIPVFAVERKPGLLSVVEIPDSPAIRVVALVAGLPEHCLVFVVITMATDAILWCVLEGGRDMTLLARRRSVKAEKGEMGYIVVEDNAFAPRGFVVATLALFALLALVDIVVAVTVDTVTRQFLSGQIASMAC